MKTLKKLPWSFLMVFAFIFYLFLIPLSNAQSDTILPQSSQINQLALKTGSYNLLLRISNPIVDPGEELYIDVYISGYGLIKFSKLSFLLSPNVFDSSNSLICSGFKAYKNEIGFCGQWNKIDEIGSAIELTAAKKIKNGWLTLYSPYPEGSLHIISETSQQLPTDKQAYAPVNLRMKIHKKARPGPQSIQFVFVYYNGESWVSSVETAQFTVRDFYQRNEWWIWWIAGIFAAVITILAGIKEAAKILIKIWSFFCAGVHWIRRWLNKRSKHR